jgi:cell division protein ZapA
LNKEQEGIPVEILGVQYRIKGDADPEYVKEVAYYVDSKMREISQRFSVGSPTKAAVLAALNIADELFSERSDRSKLLATVEEKAEQLSDMIETDIFHRRRKAPARSTS